MINFAVAFESEGYKSSVFAQDCKWSWHGWCRLNQSIWTREKSIWSWK